MIVAIDEHSPIPPYEQLRAQIQAMADAGTLAAGDRLPTVRQLARDLGIAPGTVQRAYRELLEAGTVCSRGRHGTFIASRDTSLAAAEADSRLQAAAQQLLLLASQLGRSPADAIEAVRLAGERPIPADQSSAGVV